MRTRIAAGLVAGITGLVVLLGGAGNPVSAQPDKDKGKGTPPKHLYGHDLRVRNGGEPHFDKNTPRVGIELFQDEATKALVAISHAGAITVAKASPPGPDKTSKWLTANDLACRKADEAEFTQKTKKWGVELFRDLSSNQLLYACESGSIALGTVPASLVTDKGPKWHHALVPKVRGPKQDRFDDAKKIGMEVFKDENTGGLVYITETGGIAAATTTMPHPDAKKIQPPKTQYGLVLRVRKADEPNFTDKTKEIGVEVFEDPNAGVVFYITEAGFVATAPVVKYPPEAKGVTWKSAMALRPRKGGEEKFETAQKFGVEVFEDNRTGSLIFISETGAIAVLPK